MGVRAGGRGVLGVYYFLANIITANLKRGKTAVKGGEDPPFPPTRKYPAGGVIVEACAAYDGVVHVYMYIPTIYLCSGGVIQTLPHLTSTIKMEYYSFINDVEETTYYAQQQVSQGGDCDRTAVVLGLSLGLAFYIHVGVIQGSYVHVHVLLAAPSPPLSLD